MVDIVTMHINLILLYADINESPIYIIMLHIDIIYLAYRGPKLATIQMKSWPLYKISIFLHAW